ncbi:hypothetical protein HID58_030703, partial [Brassica napus]
MLLNFDDVSAGLSESEFRFRLIGLELLMIDEQGFISSNWVVRHQGNLNCGTIYQLMNFFATKANTSIYRVVDDNLTIRFTHSLVLSELQDNPVVIQRDRFRYEVINAHSLNQHAVLDGVDGGWQHSLWDHAAKEFYSKFNESLAAPAALLVTTVNTKHIGGILRQCVGSYHRLLNMVVSFDFIATIDTSTRTRGGITSPAVTSILRLTDGQLHLCFQKMWRLQRHWSCNISAYDYGEKGTFVLLGNAGPELIGRQASELFDNYSEGNGDMGANHEMTAPQCMDTTGQTHKFSLQLELFSNETNHKCDKWCLSFCSSTYKSRSSTPGAVNVCNTAIGGTCSTWSLAEPSASSKESVVQDKAKYKASLNQPQSRNPNH